VKAHFSLAVHGGAGRLSPGRTREPGRAPYDEAIARALRAGIEVLQSGGSAVRAVTAAVVVMEDDEMFNAGRGAALCADGSVELSAAVMNGRNLAVGALVGVGRTKNPVLGAQALMKHSHCLLFGAQGDDFSEQQGLELVPRDYFFTRSRRRQWQLLSDRTRIHLDHSGEDAHGTVGAVARDRRGALAAATSTGGMLNQLPGRVGDSPVAGAGTFANSVCAISATGTGDAFFRVSFARRVADLIELARLSGGDAAERALGEVKAVRGQGGCILVDAEGRVSCNFNSPQMVRGWVTEGGPIRVAILRDDERTLR
jgi:beta-aspartyl-peptidase (threonine type)